MRVLIVEDEVVIRKGIRALLSKCHKAIRKISEASHGKAALEMIAQEKPDVIITDIRMQVMDGLKFIEEVRKHHTDIEIVILTGHADFLYAQKAVRFGVLEYLLKPITQEDLNEVIVKILMKNPEKWTEDVTIIRHIKQITNELVKAVIAEDEAAAMKLLNAWKQECEERKFSLLEIKQLMGYFHFAYKSELLLFRQDLSNELQFQHSPAASIHEVFEQWQTYIKNQMLLISEQRSPRNKRIIDAVLQEIHKNYGNTDLSIHTLAAQVGVTPPHLSKMFRELMKLPLTQYISNYRLERVKDLLEQNEMLKINVIAERCGFNDYPYFSKVFKRHFGVSPLEYRDKYMSS